MIRNRRTSLGLRVEWDAEIITDKPNETIAWRSLPGSMTATAGSVHFLPAPGDRGTEVKVEMKYEPPGGKFSATLAELLGEGIQRIYSNESVSSLFEINAS